MLDVVKSFIPILILIAASYKQHLFFLVIRFQISVFISASVLSISWSSALNLKCLLFCKDKN